MYNPTTVLNQILHTIPKYEFESFVKAHNADKYVKSLSTWNQFVILATAQIKGWDSLREVETGFLVNSNKLYHLGLLSNPKRSNLSYANTNRSCEIYESLFYTLLTKFKGKLIGKKLKFKAPLYVMDSTFIEFCTTFFDWAKFRYNKGAIKIHTTFEVSSQVPTFIRITNGDIHDLEGMDHNYSGYSDSIIVFDRIYTDISKFKDIDDSKSTFVIRLKTNVKYHVVRQQSVKFNSGIISDEVIKFSAIKSFEKYPKSLRLVTFYDKEEKRTFKFLTNNFKYSASTIAYIYKKRWEIELFFKWIKQNLKIKTFLGTSENAVKTQIWIAMIVYLVLSYFKSQGSYPYKLLEFSRVIKEILFSDMDIFDVLSANFRSLKKIIDFDVGQLNMI